MLLAEMSVSHAEAGADFVAPSDMMDGRIQNYSRSFGRRRAYRYGNYELQCQVRKCLLRPVSRCVGFSTSRFEKRAQG